MLWYLSLMTAMRGPAQPVLTNRTNRAIGQDQAGGEAACLVLFTGLTIASQYKVGIQFARRKTRQGLECMR